MSSNFKCANVCLPFSIWNELVVFGCQLPHALGTHLDLRIPAFATGISQSLLNGTSFQTSRSLAQHRKKNMNKLLVWLIAKIPGWSSRVEENTSLKRFETIELWNCRVLPMGMWQVQPLLQVKDMALLRLKNGSNGFFATGLDLSHRKATLWYTAT